jgi:hypothetical protein
LAFANPSRKPLPDAIAGAEAVGAAGRKAGRHFTDSFGGLN